MDDFAKFQDILPVEANEEFPIDARVLHHALEVKTEFKNWIKRRLEETDAREGKDFRSFLTESTGGRPSKEYNLTLSLAKEFAMLERNKIGKEVRRYFIACEEQLQIQIHPQLTQEKYSLVQLATEYKAALELASLFFEENQAKISANNATKEITNIDVLKLMGATYLIEKNPDELLTPAELGKRLNLSTRRTNALLELVGFQIRRRDDKNRLYWELTEVGQNYAVYIDSGRKQANGTPIRQIKWHVETVNQLKMVW